MKLNGKRALITGGSSGIGKAIAKRFAREGAKVVVFDLQKPDYKVDFYRVDVRKERPIVKGLSSLRQLDILVNNAGIYIEADVDQTTEEQLDNIMDTNFKGTYLMCKHALALIKQSKGTIINIASAVGVAPEPGSPAYCASKAAVIMLTKCMAQEYGQIGVRVNAILPGPVDTPLLRKAFLDLRGIGESNPMKRLAQPEEVANVALFLASAEAAFVTGGMYAVDGGESTSSLYSAGVNEG